MRGLVLCVLGLLCLVLVAAKSQPDDSIAIHHNQPHEVEQQAGQCHDWPLPSLCVSNDGSTYAIDPACGTDEVWDPDDRMNARSWDGHLVTCQFSDWATQSYFLTLTAKSKGGNQDMWIRVTLDPPLDLVGDGTTDPVEGFYYDTIEEWSWEKGPWIHVRGCFDIDLTSYGDEQNKIVYPEVPYQGGVGILRGHAIPTTITYTFPEGAALGVDKRGIERCPR